MIIGLTGRKRSGKSTAAAHLVENHGFTELSFAAPLKEMTLAIDPIVSTSTPAHWSRDGYLRLSDVVEADGWESAKDLYPEVRRFLQRLGTDGVRNHLGENIWADKVAEQILDIRSDDIRKRGGEITPIVIADVRFENEASVIRRAGGSVVEIHRPFMPASEDTHASENGVEWDYQVLNLEVAKLHAEIDRLVGWIS